MTELTEIKTILIEQGKKLNDIHFSIYGNKEAGIKGIACLVREHDKYIQIDKKVKWVGLGIMIPGGAGMWELIRTFFRL